MKKGEIWRVRLPISAGHAQGGDRPAVIMTKPSVALVFQLRALDRRDLVDFQGVLDDQMLKQLESLIDALVG